MQTWIVRGSSLCYWYSRGWDGKTEPAPTHRQAIRHNSWLSACLMGSWHLLLLSSLPYFSKLLPPHFLPSLHSSTPSHVSLIHQFPMIKCPWVPPSDRKSLGSNTWRCDVTEATAVSHLKMLRGTCDYKPLEGSNSRGKDLSGRWTGRRKWKQIQFLLQTTFLRTYHIRHCQMLSDLLCHT